MLKGIEYMTIAIYPWEEKLLQKAKSAVTESIVIPQRLLDERNLSRAYAKSARVTEQHSKTFYLTSGLLDRKARKAARALYAFCRITDDIMDTGSGDRLATLEAWRVKALEYNPNPEEVPLAWADTRQRYGIPKQYAEHLLDGVAQDLVINEYQNFEELAHYCYSVASTVGLMSMYIIGFSSEQAIPYAIKLGVALQLTNILRDVGEDWRNGRVYLPQDELVAFGLSNTDLERGIVDDRWREFMAFQIQRTRKLYEEAIPGIAYLNRRGRFAIAASAELYRAILNDIEANDYDVFHLRAQVNKIEKLTRLPGIWLRSSLAKVPQHHH